MAHILQLVSLTGLRLLGPLEVESCNIYVMYSGPEIISVLSIGPPIQIQASTSVFVSCWGPPKEELMDQLIKARKKNSNIQKLINATNHETVAKALVLQ
jgi:hypothetical protein